MMKLRSMICLSKIKTVLLVLTILSFLITLWTNPVFAGPVHRPIAKPRLVPASLLKWPEEGSDYAILVDKSTQQVFVYHRDDLFTPVKIYTTSTGENDGPKTRRNDRKTPEGVYFFTETILKKDLAPIYGSRAFPIDYPNPLDKKEGKNGYGIWFHGTNKPLKPYDSNGCIVLDNPHIDELASYIQLRDTPAIISSKVEMVDPDALVREKMALEEMIEGWRKGWESKEIDRYMSFYGSKFSSGGKNWHQWKKYKARLARKYPQIEVEIDNLRLFKNDGIVLAKFDQRYSTPWFESWGEKRLFLQQNSDEWKIVGEFFQVAKRPRTAPKKDFISASEDIKIFLSSWKKAWEEKDLETYISHYDPQFRSRGMDLDAWKTHRERLNRKYGSLKIDIRDVIVVQISNDTAKVSFKQDYRANGYRDFGLKKILLIKEGQHWKIKKEEWSPLRR
jgi:murein L,D-transpeptidase YafK